MPELNMQDIAQKALDCCKEDRKLIDDTYQRFMATYNAMEASGVEMPDSIVNGIVKTLQLKLEATEKSVTQLLRIMVPQASGPKEKTLKQILTEKKEQENA